MGRVIGMFVLIVALGFGALVLLGGGGNSAQTGAGKAAGDVAGKVDPSKLNNPSGIFNGAADIIAAAAVSPWLPYAVIAVATIVVGSFLAKHKAAVIVVLVVGLIVAVSYGVSR